MVQHVSREKVSTSVIGSLSHKPISNRLASGFDGNPIMCLNVCNSQSTSGEAVAGIQTPLPN